MHILHREAISLQIYNILSREDKFWTKLFAWIEGLVLPPAHHPWIHAERAIIDDSPTQGYRDILQMLQTSPQLYS